MPFDPAAFDLVAFDPVTWIWIAAASGLWLLALRRVGRDLRRETAVCRPADAVRPYGISRS